MFRLKSLTVFTVLILPVFSQLQRACDLRNCQCAQSYIPFCGTDGITYGNICSLECAQRQCDRNLKVKFEGVCPEKYSHQDNSISESRKNPIAIQPPVYRPRPESPTFGKFPATIPTANSWTYPTRSTPVSNYFEYKPTQRPTTNFFEYGTTRIPTTNDFQYGPTTRKATTRNFDFGQTRRPTTTYVEYGTTSRPTTNYFEYGTRRPTGKPNYFEYGTSTSRPTDNYFEFRKPKRPTTNFFEYSTSTTGRPYYGEQASNNFNGGNSIENDQRNTDYNLGKENRKQFRDFYDY